MAKKDKTSLLAKNAQQWEKESRTEWNSLNDTLANIEYCLVKLDDDIDMNSNPKKIPEAIEAFTKKDTRKITADNLKKHLGKDPFTNNPRKYSQTDEEQIARDYLKLQMVIAAKKVDELESKLEYIKGIEIENSTTDDRNKIAIAFAQSLKAAIPLVYHINSVAGYLETENLGLRQMKESSLNDDVLNKFNDMTQYALQITNDAKTPIINIGDDTSPAIDHLTMEGSSEQINSAAYLENLQKLQQGETKRLNEDGYDKIYAEKKQVWKDQKKKSSGIFGSIAFGAGVALFLTFAAIASFQMLNFLDNLSDGIDSGYDTQHTDTNTETTEHGGSGQDSYGAGCGDAACSHETHETSKVNSTGTAAISGIMGTMGIVAVGGIAALAYKASQGTTKNIKQETEKTRNFANAKEAAAQIDADNIKLAESQAAGQTAGGHASRVAAARRRAQPPEIG